jgi:hypothetical protein
MQQRVRQLFYAAAFFIAAAVICGSIANADAPSVGLTTAFSFGSHAESAGPTKVPLLPIPLVQVRVPLKRFEIAAEGVPPIGPVPYNSDLPGVSRSTRLSYAYAALCYRMTGTISIGVGETLYNQRTVYNDSYTYRGYLIGSSGQRYPFSDTHTQTEIDSSRVPGARYEVQGRWPLRGNRRFIATLSVSPVMHAIVLADDKSESQIQTTAPISSPPFSWTSSVGSPETASEVDGSIALARRVGPITLTYGVRYLNYVARFNRSGRLADRNTLVLPFVGFERALGH